ncbi:MAG: hypothetical protein QW320_11605 [Ignisphaera sp.]
MKRPKFSQKYFTKKELVELYKDLMKRANDWAIEDVDQWIIGSLIDAAIGIVNYQMGSFRTIDYFFE